MSRDFGAPEPPGAEAAFQHEQGLAVSKRTRVAFVVAIVIHLVNLPTNDAMLVGYRRALPIRGLLIALCVLGYWLVRRAPVVLRRVERVAGAIWLGQVAGLGALEWLSPNESLEAWSNVFVFGTMVLSLSCGFSGSLTATLILAGNLSQVCVLVARLGHPNDLPLQLPVVVALVLAARARERLARAEVKGRFELAALQREHLRAQRSGFVAELHDGPVASVARAAVLFDRASREGRDGEALEAARRGLRDALAEARALMSDLDEPLAAWRDLVADVRRELYDACEGAGLDCHFEVSSDDEGAPSPEVAHAVRRTVREGTTNVIRHARASRISCVLARAGGTVTVEVQDDGQGLADDRTGRGLGILRDRARRLLGDVEIGPVASGGALLRVRLREPRRDGPTPP